MGGVGCDNMTVIIACFLHNNSYLDLSIKCAQPLVPISTHSQTPDQMIATPLSSTDSSDAMPTSPTDSTSPTDPTESTSSTSLVNKSKSIHALAK